MSAAEITESLSGSLVSAPSKTGTALKMGVYSATKSTQNDWIIFGDFTVVTECVAYTVNTGARTAEAFTIDGSTTNKVTLTSSTTGTVSVVVWGY